MESTDFHQAHYKSTKKLSSQTSSVSYVKRGKSIFFSSSSIHKGCNIGHGFSPVAGLFFYSKNIFLQSGLTDMTTSCLN